MKTYFKSIRKIIMLPVYLIIMITIMLISLVQILGGAEVEETLSTKILKKIKK